MELGEHSREFNTCGFCRSMRKDIAIHVVAYVVCQQQRTSTLSPGLLQPLPIPNQIWQDISADIIEGLPKSKELTHRGGGGQAH